MVTEQIGAGEQYGKIKPAICILITDFTMVPENERYHNRFRLHDPATGADFANLLHIHTLELPKLPKEADGTKLWSWLEFLKAQNKEELEMLAKTNPEVKKAVVRIIELSADEKTRMLHEAHEKAVRDQYAREEFVREETRKEALKEGREEGRKEMQIAVARNALQQNIPIENIMALTDLTREEIQALLH
jgi:predicted transposase/invertase (TIGR01784 family)